MPCNNGQKAKRTRKGNSKESEEVSTETASRKLRSRSSAKQEAMDVQKKCESDEDHQTPPSECLEVDLALNKNDDHSTGQTEEDNIETITELVMDKQAHDEAGGPASFNPSTNGATSSNMARNVCTADMTQNFQDISGEVFQNNNSEKINSGLLESPMIIEGNSSTCETRDGKDCVNSSDKYDEHKQLVNCLQLEPVLTSNYEHFKEESVYEMMDVQRSDCSMNNGTQSQICAVGNPSGVNAGQDVDDCEVTSKNANNINTNSDTNSHHPSTSLSTDTVLSTHSSKMQVCKIRLENSSPQTNGIIENLSQITTNDLYRSMQTNLCDSLNKDTISAQQSSKLLKRTLHSPLSNSQIKKFKSPCPKNIPEVESSSTNCSTQDMSWELSTQTEIISDIQKQDGCKSELKLSKGHVQTIIESEQLQSSIADITNNASNGIDYEGVLFHRPVVVEAVEGPVGDKGKYSARDEIGNQETVSQRQMIMKTNKNNSAEEIYPVGNNMENKNSVGEGHLTIEATKEKVLEETSPSTTKHNYTALVNADVNAPHSSLLHVQVNGEANVTKTTETSEKTPNQLISNTSTYSSGNGEQQQQDYQEKSLENNKDQEELGAYSGCQVLDVKHASLGMSMIVSSNSGDAGGLLKPLSSFNTSVDTGDKQCPDLMNSSTEKGEVRDDISTMKQAAIHNKNAGTVNASYREVINKFTNENEILEIVVLDSNVKDTHNLSTGTPQAASLQELNNHQFKLLPDLATQDMPQSLHCPENKRSYTAMNTQPNSFQNCYGDLPCSSNVDIANSHSPNKHVYSTLNMDTKEGPLVHGEHLQSTMTAQLTDLTLVPNVTPLNKALPEETLGPEVSRIDNETISPTSMSEQQEQESKQIVQAQSNMNLPDVRTQTCISEAALLTDNKTPFLMNKPTYHLNTDDSQSRQISFLAKERTSANSQLPFGNLNHHSQTNILRTFSKRSLDSQEKLDAVVNHSDIEGGSTTQSSHSNQQESYRDKPSQSIKNFHGAPDVQYNSPSDQQEVSRKQQVTTLYETSNNLLQYNSPSDQQQVSRKQPVTTLYETSNNILQYNLPSDQPKACTQNPTSFSTDLHETSNVTKNDTILDSAMDLSDSQICQLTTEDYANPFSCTPPEDIDATGSLDKFKHNFDSAHTKAAKDIEKRKGEGKKLVDEIMSDLVSLNKQLLRMKKEMEGVRRVVQQQHGKAGFSYTSSHMFGNGS